MKEGGFLKKIGLAGLTTLASVGATEAVSAQTHTIPEEQATIRDNEILQSEIKYELNTYNPNLESKLALLKKILPTCHNPANIALINGVLEFANKGEINDEDVAKALNLILDTGAFIVDREGKIGSSMGMAPLEPGIIALSGTVIISKIKTGQVRFVENGVSDAGKITNITDEAHKIIR